MNEKKQIVTDPLSQEVKKHGNFSFPLLISEETLSNYKSGSFSCHWHKEIEFTLVLDGTMIYQINKEIFHLTKGDVLFENSNTLHTGYMNKNRDCHYISITFDAKLLYGYEGSLFQTKFVNPILQNKALSAIHFNQSEDWHRDLTNYFYQIYELEHQDENLYEFELQLLLLNSWKLILLHNQSLEKSISKREEININRVKEMLSFIHENYMLKITLEDISTHIHVCKSECCKIFKKIMKISLFDYILKYRIEKSLYYLIVLEYSITEVALTVGFTDPNYYTKIFRKLMGCSPSKYRMQQ